MAKVIPSTWSLPPVIVARFGTSAGRQRAMFHEQHLVLVTHLVPTSETDEHKAALFWRDPSGAWKAGGEAKGGLSALKDLVDSYVKRALALETLLEGARRAADYFAVLQEIAPLVRAARALHKTLQEAREAVPGDKDIIALRDTAQEAERMAELTQSDAKSGMDFTVAKRAEEQAELSENIARSSHRLNLIAALFMPVSALGSVFGVNLAHGLEHTAAPYLFWAFVGASFAVGFLVRATIDDKPVRS